MMPFALRSIATLFVLSVLATDLSAQETELGYTMILQEGGRVPVTINWSDLSGQAAISGEMRFDAGELAFTGENSRPGYIWLRTENGILSEFWRKPLSEGFFWEGKTHYRDHSELVKLMPTVVRTMKPVANREQLETRSRPSRNDVSTRTYRAKVGDSNEALCVIYWQNIKGLAAVDGEFRSGEAILSFTGMNKRSGYLELYDADGRKFELLSSKNRNGEVQWSGTVTAENGETAKLRLTALD